MRWIASYPDVLFQPALPMRGVTFMYLRRTEEELFQPALPMRGVTIPTPLRADAI